MTNAFEPPKLLFAEQTAPDNEVNSLSVGLGCMLLPGLGAIVGFLGFFGMAMILEAMFPLPSGAPVLSHGQQAALFTLPICTLAGFGIGIGLAFAFSRQRAIAIIALLSTSAITYAINNRLWVDQISRYGRDYSEMVLYYPPTIFAVAAMVLAVLVAGLAATSSIFRLRGDQRV